MSIRQKVEELREVIREELGLEVYILISAHETKNKLDFEKAYSTCEKVADEYGSTVEKSNNNGIHWCKVDPWKNDCEFTVFYTPKVCPSCGRETKGGI